jgi:hypothetical protein
MTNFLDENYLKIILRDLTSLRASVKKMLVGGQVVDIMELICGEQYTMERAETAARTGWTTDPVHPSRHTVAKIGLHLIEKMGNYTPVGSGDGGKKVSSSLRLDNRVDRNEGGMTAVRKRECPAGPPGVRAGRRGDAVVAACGAATWKELWGKRWLHPWKELWGKRWLHPWKERRPWPLRRPGLRAPQSTERRILQLRIPGQGAERRRRRT